MVTHDKLTLQEMICVLEPIMERPNLDVKASKCAELLEQLVHCKK